jgi:hypothetical protein
MCFPLTVSGVFILELRPTPELSFAVKHLGCQCGMYLLHHTTPRIQRYTAQIVPPG